MAFYLKIVLLLITAFLIRPTALGQDYTTIGLATALGAFLFHLLDCKYDSSKTVRTNTHSFIIMSLVFVLFGYLLAHALIMSSPNLMNVLKATISHCSIIILAAFILSDDRANRAFFRSFTFILISFVVSYYITLLLTLVVPLERMELFRIDFGGYTTAGKTYFPFTILYGVFTVENIELPRLLGLFRESGILQMFLIWSLFTLKTIGLDKLWIKAVLILGIIASFSTAGLAIFFASVILLYVLNKKIVRAALLIVLAYGAIMYAPFIGLNEKIQTHGSSITDRTEAIQAGLTSLTQDPFGVGMYNSTGHNSGINLIATSYMIGIIGFLLTLIVYISPLITVRDKKLCLLALTPIILTSLFSQPLLDAPLLYIMLMARYEKIIISPKEASVGDLMPNREGSKQQLLRNESVLTTK